MALSQEDYIKAQQAYAENFDTQGWKQDMQTNAPEPVKEVKPDFDLADHGTVFLLTPRNEAAQEWVAENLADAMTFGQSVAIEHRFVGDIVTGIQGDGFSIQQ